MLPLYRNGAADPPAIATPKAALPFIPGENAELRLHSRVSAWAPEVPTKMKKAHPPSSLSK